LPNQWTANRVMAKEPAFRAWSEAGDSAGFPSPTPMPLPPRTPTRPSTRRIEPPASSSSFEALPGERPPVRARNGETIESVQAYQARRRRRYVPALAARGSGSNNDRL
jgi:hypothetical protein